MTNPHLPQPGDPTQNAQQSQFAPPAKKRRKWPWIVGGIVVLLIAIGAFSDPKETSKGTSEGGLDSAQGGTQDAGNAHAVINTPVRDGKFEFVVTGVQPGLAEIGDNPYLVQKAQGQFVVVSMSVKNIGDKPQSFSPSAQKLFDAEGRSFESDTMAQVALGDSDVPVYDNINPGNGVDVKVVYDMPPDAVPTTIELHDSVFSGGVKVSLNAGS
ncbi:DUF4352 domain-containing protein [Mycolicibacter kumamotonensis]|uniref:Mpr protein n=1 Tax=Mycolicibacter kumamotonensis TaxID=354243 RepID=A0A1B8SLE1_9MYCO|nr:DUF4352 domain-containing protein [Mycolicibacter kumamotonensis]OBY33559.1 Mpr protein [Mycolicibacter kumamotonensis]